MNELQITTKSTYRELIAPEGMVVCNKRTGAYYGRRVPVPLTADLADYESAIKPAYSKEEYDAMVARLVRERYSADEEFALQRKAINAVASPATYSVENDKAMEEYQAYNEYVELCKARAKDPELYENHAVYG